MRKTGAGAPRGGDDARAADIEALLHAVYIGAPGTALREEDRRKARELVGLAAEIELALGRASPRRELVIVDAAAGKAYASLIAAKLVLADKPWRAVAVERSARLLEAARHASQALGLEGRVELRAGDVGDPALWPREPDLVVALHACGPASDDVLDAAVAARAKHLLLVPCCTSERVEAASRARVLADQQGVPRHAEVRRRFIQAMVDAERTLRLEASGYHVEVVAFVPPTVTPHNLLWRARRVHEPARMQEAQRQLAQLFSA